MILVFWIGVYPKPLFERIEPAVKQVITQVGRATTVEVDENYQIKRKLATADAVETEVTFQAEELSDE